MPFPEQTNSLIDKISSEAYQFTPEGIESYIPQILEQYQVKIQKLANRIYSFDNSVGKLAFKKEAEETIKNGLDTFLFRYRHWEESRNLHHYLLACLNTLSKQVKSRLDGSATNLKQKVPICPNCRSYLILTFKSAICQSCQNQAENSTNKEKKYLYHTFAKHSLKYKECPNCFGFLPESLGEGKIKCPFLDCCFEGELKNLNKKNILNIKSSGGFCSLSIGVKIHENTNIKSVFKNKNSQIDKTYGLNWKHFNSLSKSSFQDLLPDHQILQDKKIEINEEFIKNLNIIYDLIEQLYSQIEFGSHNYTLLQKKCMLQAFLEVINLFPKEMVRYLVNLDKSEMEFSLQAKIFQKYVTIIENKLPFQIKKNLITDLTDPRLNLFLGESQYEAVLNNEFIIENLTKEEYIGKRTFTNQGKCFIGYLIDIVNLQTQKSILSEVEYYTFDHIKIVTQSKLINKLDSVLIKHFRIQPHYEVGHMIFLQKIKNELVDSIYFRLHGKKRK